MDGEAFKTIRARVWLPTNIKLERLRWLYAHWGETGYRMHDNEAARHRTKRVLNQWSFNLKEDPNSTVALVWMRIPITKGERRSYALRMAPEH